MKVLIVVGFLLSTNAFSEVKGANCREELREYSKARRVLEKSMSNTLRWYEMSVESYRDIATQMTAGTRISYNFALTARNNADVLRRNFNMELEKTDTNGETSFTAFTNLEDCLLDN